jgi:carbon storage regulator
VLVLTRKPEQSLLLGESIVLTVLAIEGDRVKLGIQAPRDISVLRQEIHAQLKAANTQAAQIAPNQVRSIAEVLRQRSASGATRV